MSQPSTAELRRMARETLGRELDDAELEAMRHRLPTMIKSLDILRDREARLRDIEPVTVYRVPEQGGTDRGGD